MASSIARNPIRTPFRRRIRLMRQRMLPVGVWLGAIAVLVLLAHRQQSSMTVLPGVVEQREVTVAPLAEGTVSGILVDLYDDVEAGKVVARMDDALLRTELLAARVELGQLNTMLAEAEQQAAETRGEQATEMRRFALDYEAIKLERLDRWAEQEEDRVTLRRVESLAERQRRMVADGVFDELTYEQTRLECESLRRRVEESDRVLAEAETQIDEAEARLVAYRETAGSLSFDAAIARVSDAIALQEAFIQGLQERMAQLDLRAPIAGKVARIYYVPGETITRGAPLMTIVDPRPRRVTAYVDERAAVDLAVGSEMQVYAQAQPDRVIAARVLKVGDQLEPYPLDAAGQTHGMGGRVGQQVDPFPQHLRVSTMQMRWGRPILLGELPDGAFMPGQPVMVRYTPASRVPFLDSLL